jgi:hypothetical protein
MKKYQKKLRLPHDRMPNGEKIILIIIFTLFAASDIRLLRPSLWYPRSMVPVPIHVLRWAIGTLYVRSLR